MTKVELERKLKDMNIKETMYDLNGGLPNEAYCMEEIGGKWCTSLKAFETEQEACSYFLDWIKNH